MRIATEREQPDDVTVPTVDRSGFTLANRERTRASDARLDRDVGKRRMKQQREERQLMVETPTSRPHHNQAPHTA